MDELLQYQQQLSQVQLEISHCNEDEDKIAALKQLESDIKELIGLIQISQPGGKAEDSLDAEYELFKAELAATEDSSENQKNQEEVTEALNKLHEDLQSLPGQKCQAPFKHSWCDQPVYHNALVFKVENSSDVSSAEDLLVRVMFTNPTESDMKPCPYFLEGECRFTKEKCRFSHGEIVPFVDLKEYKDPNFSALATGSRALVKQPDSLWCMAIIQSVSDDKCVVKLESTSREEEVDLQHIFPLDNAESDLSRFDDSFSDGDSDENDSVEVQTDMMEVLRKMPTSSALGSWEQHTKGFGSRLMARLGYINGTGLGVNADGRIEPVPAVIYPAGKSLDHCMMLKEKSGGDQDLFKAERKMKIKQRKHEEALSRAYEKEKQRTDVFTFLNGRLGQSDKPEVCPAGPSSQKALQNATEKNLNVNSLQIAEDVKRTEKEKKKFNEALGRHAVSSPAHEAIKEKIRQCDDRLSQLHASDRKISTELKQRNDRKKLSIF